MTDPFREHPAKIHRRQMTLLGARFDFRSDSGHLVRLLEAAYSGLPGIASAGGKGRALEVRLALQSPMKSSSRTREPPRPHAQAGAGLICAVMDAHNFVALDAQARRGLVAISQDMLRFAYHVRYELLEFAVFTLATRALNLVPLHAACVAHGGRAVLLVGESGAGKSTLTLQCMLGGLQLVAEDAVFIDPARLATVGVPNFLHLRGSSLRFIADRAVASHVRASPVIRRRSGVRKYEVDLRGGRFPITTQPMSLAGVIFVTQHLRDKREILRPLAARSALRRLTAAQPYAASLASWQPFAGKLAHIPAFELGRARHPQLAAEALMRLLSWGR